MSSAPNAPAVPALPEKLLQKLRQAQRAVEPLVKDHKTTEDGYDFVPAADVYDKIARELHVRQVLLVPRLRDVEPVVANGKLRFIANMTLGLVNAATSGAGKGESAELRWAGEGETLAGAYTQALKTFLVALFQVPLFDPPPADRNDRRRRAVKSNPKLTSRQIDGLVKPAIAKAKLSEEQLAGILRGRFDVDELDDVPRSEADVLVKAITEVAAA